MAVAQEEQKDLEPQPVLLLIDGHSMAFRAFYALQKEAFRTSSGVYTNAVLGFTNTLLHLVKRYSPEYLAVAFDLPGGTFRTRRYPEYKAGRKATPEEFIGQIDLIQKVLTVLGITWITCTDYEADDIVATLATLGEHEGMRIFVASGDKDSYQLVNSDVTVLYPMPRSQMKEMTPQAILDKTGVLPQRYEDVAALVGENADNIPGVPGVGPKTAAKWINKYGTLEQLLVHADELRGKVGQSLRDSIEQVKLNRSINESVRTLPIFTTPSSSSSSSMPSDCEKECVNSPENIVVDSNRGELTGFESLLLSGVNVPAMHKLFDDLEFSSLRARVLSHLPALSDSSEPVSSTDLHTPHIRTLRSVTTVHSQKDMSAFIECHTSPYSLVLLGDKRPGHGKVDEYICASDDGFAVRGSTCEGEKSVQALQEFLTNPDIPIVTHGSKDLFHAVAPICEHVNAVKADTELEAYLLHPDERSYDIDDLSRKYLGVDLENSGSVANQQTSLALSGGETSEDNDHENQENSDHIAYLAHYALSVLNVHEELSYQLEQHGCARRLRRLELDVAHVLASMEERGIAVDQERLAELTGEFRGKVHGAERVALEAAGRPELNLSSPKQLQTVLFDDMGLPHTKKTKRGYTTNAQALSELLTRIAYDQSDTAVRGQQFLTALLEHRDASKLLQTTEGLQRAVQTDGRIHTTYQQTVTATGRLSSTDPNLQNIHARTQEGLQIRSIFVPGSDFDYLMTADYSQIEMRIMAHMSNDTELIEAFNSGADLHRYVASRVFRIPEDEVTSVQRTRIKAMSYGLVYGLSAYGLSKQLHISVSEAQELMGEYFSRFGKVKHHLEELVGQARTCGYTETILGRRRYIPNLTSMNRQAREAAERMALNAPIQGSAADIIKIAMVNTEAAFRDAGLASRILLQVHDELVLEVLASEADQVRDIVTREMSNAWPELSVPLTVGIGIGRDWREAAH